MLFKPVYLKPKMKEAFIPMAAPQRSPSPSPPPPPPPEPEVIIPPEPEIIPDPPSPPQEVEEEHLPVLVNNFGMHMIYPSEARRDVLSGKVAYMYIDAKGVTIFRPKHIFTALNLGTDQRKKYEDYPCIGAHQRTFERKPRPNGRNYSVPKYDNDEERNQWAMSSFSRGSSRPRA